MAIKLNGGILSLKAEEELFTSLIYRRKIIIENRQTDFSKM